MTSSNVPSLAGALAMREAAPMSFNPFSGDFGDFIRRNTARFPMIVQLVAVGFAITDPKTPAWAKAILGAAVAYVLCPLDAIPDYIPVLGWADDVGVLGAALGGVAGAFVTEEHRQAARRFLGLE
jgi:uncharacterized membrane protein YkvA (DUF1232 family)